MVRLRQLWAAIVLVLPALSLAQKVLPTEDLSPCAKTCLTSLLPPTQTANYTFICTDADFSKQLLACVTKNCTIREQLTSINVVTTSCQVPKRNRSHVILIISIVGAVFGLVSVIFRLIGRHYTLGNGSNYGFGLDDYAIIFSVCNSVALSAVIYPVIRNGFGQDVWTLPFDDIPRFLLLFWITEIFYNIVIMVTKISVLCFYLRIFQRRGFKLAVYGTMMVSFGFLISFLTVLLLQCRPIENIWLGWDGTRPGKCLDFNANVFASAGLNITLDLVICLMSLPELRTLKLSFKKKVAIFSMLGVGLITTVISGVRLTTLVKVGKSSNPTYDYLDASAWSIVEINVGIFCACMPGIRAFFKVVLPFMFKDPKDRKYAATLPLKEFANTKRKYQTTFSQVETKDDVNVSIRVAVDDTIAYRSYDRSGNRSPSWR